MLNFCKAFTYSSADSNIAWHLVEKCYLATCFILWSENRCKCTTSNLKSCTAHIQYGMLFGWINYNKKQPKIFGFYPPNKTTMRIQIYRLIQNENLHKIEQWYVYKNKILWHIKFSCKTYLCFTPGEVLTLTLQSVNLISTFTVPIMSADTIVLGKIVKVHAFMV